MRSVAQAPAGDLSACSSFCGLGWENNVLDFHRSRSTVKTASVWQVRQPLHTRSSGRWQNYEKYLPDLNKLRGRAAT